MYVFQQRLPQVQSGPANQVSVKVVILPTMPDQEQQYGTRAR